MDAHEVWQENKRWIVGVLLGAVVFFIGKTVVSSMSDPAGDATVRRAVSTAREVGGEPRYDRAALSQLQEEDARLARLEQELRRAVVFEPREEFRLEGKGMFDLHLDKMSRDVRARLIAGADRGGVDLDPRGLSWPTDITTREDAESVLIALDLLDDAMQRVYAAGQAVRDQRYDALGLVSVDELKVEGPGRGARQGRGARRRPGSAGDDELVREQRVAFKLRADAETVRRTIEALRGGDRPIAIADLVVAGDTRRSGDALVVTGKFLGVQVLPAPAGEAAE